MGDFRATMTPKVKIVDLNAQKVSHDVDLFTPIILLFQAKTPGEINTRHANQ